MSGVSVFDMFVGFLRSRGASDAVVRMFANFSFTGQIVALGALGRHPLETCVFAVAFRFFSHIRRFRHFPPCFSAGDMR